MTRENVETVGGVTISEVDFSRVSQDDIVAWLRYDAVMSAESPLTPFQLPRASLNNLPDNIAMRLFVARDPDGAVAGDGRAIMTRTPDDSQFCRIHLSVRPDRRGRGIGKALMKLIVEAAEAEGREILVGWSADRVPAGADFARRLGACFVQDLVINRLLVSELDRNTANRWVARGLALAPEYRLAKIDGSYPPDMLADILELRIIANSGHPRFLHEAPAFTVEALTAAEAKRSEQGKRLTLVILHRPTSTVAGFTELCFHKADPAIAYQAGTAVLPAHQGRGLGKWLKAAMLDLIMSEHPNIKEIRTGNAASNEAILGVNRALGFRPLTVATAWQAPVARLREAAWRESGGVSAVMNEKQSPVPNVKRVVPFLWISDMERSLRYYVNGLGFEMTRHWIDDGKVRWCRLQLGEAALMLQEFRMEGRDARRPEGKVGEGVSLVFICEDAIAFYREITSRGIAASEPCVANTMWITSLRDPDGYRLDFESRTDVPEDTKLSQVEGGL